MSSNPRRVLVTGATGFIGRFVLGPLLERGFEVHGVARTPPAYEDDVRWHAVDLLDAVARAEVLAAAAPTHLLHLAWYAEPGAFWDAGENAAWVAATVSLADAFAAGGGRRAVLAGTCAEYDWTAIEGPLAEDAPIAPATYYGRCKAATHTVVTGLAERAGIELAWGRIFFLYGPGEDERRLVAGIARTLLAGERAPSSAGTQHRDFLHVSDVAGAFVELVDGTVTGPVNIGSGEGPTVREIAEAIASAAGAEDRLDVGALPMREGDPTQIVADVRRLREEVGFTPAVGLADGLRATVAWWSERRDEP